MELKEDISEILNRVIGSQIQGVKLGPGVVGRNSSIAWALELVMLAGVVSGAVLHTVWLAGISVLGAIISGLLIARMNVKFGKDDPAAALLEGAHFLQFHQMQATATRGSQPKELPVAAPTQSPVELPGAVEKNQLPGGTSQLLMRRYVHLGINPIGGGSILTQPFNWNRPLETLLVQHGDWFRYANQNYVLFTDADLTYLSNEIKALPGFHSVFILLAEISGFDPIRCNGWMDPKFWEWLRGRRDFPFRVVPRV